VRKHFAVSNSKSYTAQDKLKRKLMPREMRSTIEIMNNGGHILEQFFF